MSILITILNHDCNVIYIAADTRTSRLDGSFENDSAKKVFQIREDLFFGVSGLTDVGLKALDLLKANKTLPASDLVELVKNFEVENIVHEGKTHGASFVLAGAYDHGEPFVFSRTTYDQAKGELETKQIEGMLEEVDQGSLVKGEACLQISAPKESTAEFVRSNFMDNLKETKGNYSQAIALCINGASEIDTSISSRMDIITYDLHTKQVLIQEISRWDDYE